MKTKIIAIWNYLNQTVGIPVVIVFVIAIAYFGYDSFRQWQIEREIQRQDERMNKYDEQANASYQNAQKHLEIAENSARISKEVVAIIGGLTAKVEKLSTEDRVITVRVNELNTDYEKTRNQKNNLPTRAARANVPLRQRERDVLAADRELYPNGAN